jgi:hypothetical protein
MRAGGRARARPSSALNLVFVEINPNWRRSTVVFAHLVEFESPAATRLDGQTGAIGRRAKKIAYLRGALLDALSLPVVGDRFTLAVTPDVILCDLRDNTRMVGIDSVHRFDGCGDTARTVRDPVELCLLRHGYGRLQDGLMLEG